MAAVSFQLTSILQETLTAQPSAAIATPVNTHPAARDTVTLTSQTVPPQQLGQNLQQQGQFQEAAFFVVEAQIFPAPMGQVTNAAKTPVPALPEVPSNGTSPAPPAAYNLGSPEGNNVNLVNAGGTANAAAGIATPQQQLQQLDQTLQHLGIDPNSISLFNRLALLLYANDPASLAAFVQQLQGVEQNGQSNASGAGTNVQAQASAQNAAVTLLANQPKGVPEGQAAVAQAAPTQDQDQTTAAQAITPLEVLAAQFTLVEPETAAPTVPAQNQTVPATQPAGTNVSAPPAGNAVFVQFAELQLAFAATAGQGQTSTSNAAAATQQGQTLNVTF